MEGLQQLVDFIETAEEDARMGMAHMSLYQVLLYEYIKRSSQSPIYVDREQVMRKAKMCRKTYQRRMKELKEYGYIRYMPCCDSRGKYEVILNRL